MEFKEIPSFPGYRISKEGVVINKDNKELTVSSKGNSRWYTFKIKGKTSVRRIHSLLEEVWQQNPWIELLEDGEEWKEVNGFENYIITSYGRVWSKHRNRWKEISKRKEKRYYYYISMRNGSKTQAVDIHRLVGTHFLQGFTDGDHILHKDETLPLSEINRVSNLFLGNDYENARDMIKKERHNKTNRLGYLGVMKNGGKTKPYVGRLCVNGDRILTSYYSTPEEAHQAYLELRMKLKGY